MLSRRTESRTFLSITNMPTYEVISMIDGEPTFKKPLKEILAELTVGGALKTLSPLEYITDRQRRWFKGVLLPALANDSGDSVMYWETKLKLAVMPDQFQPQFIAYGKQVFSFVPSITILSKRGMNLLIEGSVDKCHEWGFLWVTLPDPDLRKP